MGKQTEDAPVTAEPGQRFVLHEHFAKHHHFDLRFEHGESSGAGRSRKVCRRRVVNGGLQSPWKTTRWSILVLRVSSPKACTGPVK
jgi:hypothetical protein